MGVERSQALTGIRGDVAEGTCDARVCAGGADMRVKRDANDGVVRACVSVGDASDVEARMCASKSKVSVVASCRFN